MRNERHRNTQPARIKEREAFYKTHMSTHIACVLPAVVVIVVLANPSSLNAENNIIYIFLFGPRHSINKNQSYFARAGTHGFDHLYHHRRRRRSQAVA